ncbi:MAG: peptidoglycan DD-metalloendopeptidase family protein [Anaerotruncus sp.]|nr:peptidoglycan DD-metalloendopeptidase family protein [Anaerotruncus sp.]
MKLTGKRLIAAMMAAVICIFSAPASAAEGEENSTPDFSEERAQIDALSNQYKQLQQKQNQIQSQINQATSERAKQQAIKEQISEQINNTQQQINLLTQRIGLLNDSIAEKEVELEEKQLEIDQGFELLKKRMRAMYMSNGNNSKLGMVLDADSYSQMVMRTEVTSRIAEHDQEMLERLTSEKKELNRIKEGIESDKVRVEEDKKEMGEKKEELDGQMVQAQDKIHEYASMEQQFLANKTELRKQMQQVQAEINAIYDEINKTSQSAPYIGGDLKWPSATLFQVTSSFGTRFGGSDYHTGIDISGGGAYGSAVLAAGAGTVVKANLTYTAGYGYGIYVIVDHGGGVQTLYGHCSALNVTQGQTVAAGQQIAQVGSTGWSTGPHIHFEVRVNGKAQNPVSYLKG